MLRTLAMSRKCAVPSTSASTLLSGQVRVGASDAAFLLDLSHGCPRGKLPQIVGAHL
jgi:hypothetical protein